MRKLLIAVLAAACTIGSVAAQEETSEVKSVPRKYINFGFSTLEMHHADFPALKSNYGAAFTVGRSYFLHRKPIAGILRFGIDATWFDINYTNYKIEYREREEPSEIQNWHQAELAMQVGPSISINPVGKLNIHTYFRYAPSFSGLYDGDTFLGNYATVFVGGGAVSYGKIGLGLEARFGSSHYKELAGGGDKDKENSEASESESVPKSKFSGMRFYISLRF